MNTWNAFLFKLSELARRLVMHLARYWTWATFFLLWGPIRVNPSRIRDLKGPAIVIANHKSVFDPPIIHFVLAGREARFITKRVFTKIPVFGALITWLGAFPIDRDKPRSILKVFRKAKQLLSQGEVISLFPEGTMLFKDEIGPIGGLAVDLAVETKVPIYIIGIRGINRVFPGACLIPRRLGVRIEVMVAGPFLLTGSSSLEKRQDIRFLREKLSELSGYTLSS